MKRKRSLLFICSLLLIVVFSVACSSNAPSSSQSDGAATEESASPDQTESQGETKPATPVTVSMFTVQPDNLLDLNTNDFTKYIAENYNLNIDWVTAPPSDTTKQSLLLQSGDYPEVFWNGRFTTLDILKYAQQGIFAPIPDELIQEHAPNLWETLQNDQSLSDIARAPDGHIYGLPRYDYCLHCYFGSKYWINTALLDRYGLSMPSTTEEFEHVLEVFKENGITPLTGNVGGFHNYPVTFLMNSFIYNVDNDDASDYLAVVNGQLAFSATQPQWKQGLEYLHRLYSKGLIDTQAFTQSDEGPTRLMNQGAVGVVPSGWAAGFLDQATNNPGYKDWATIPPLKGPDGTRHAAFYGNGYKNVTFVFTNKASEEQMVAVLKVIDFLYTPLGAQTKRFGLKDGIWKEAIGGEKNIWGGPLQYITDRGALSSMTKHNLSFGGMAPSYDGKEWYAATTAALPIFSPSGLEANLAYFTQKTMAGYQPEEVYPAAVWVGPDEVQQYALDSTNINKYVRQWTAEFVVGNKSLDADWDAYVAGLQGLGLDRYMEISEKVMNKPFNTGEFAEPDQQMITFLESLKE